MTQDLPPREDGSPTNEGPAPAHPTSAVDTLRQAMRRARVDNAEHAGVLSDMRGARLVRLELLQEELTQLVAQIPPDVDMFDIAVMPGSNPRLFIDMIGFVEMGRDPKVYRLVQDTRHGRIKIAESANIDVMVDAVTDYVARRLLERDKALAADAGRPMKPASQRGAAQRGSAAPGRRSGSLRDTAAVPDAPGAGRSFEGPLAERSPPPRRVGARRWLSIAFAFLIDLLGSVAFFSILAVVAWYLWNRMHTPI